MARHGGTNASMASPADQREARAGMRLAAVYSTDEGSALRRLRKDDPLPMAFATAEA